ncbi:ABC transporter ATP-binding protein [Solibacillus sp. MA9]|uniref:ABC transporter ATP-binding protein n=1 Tax=Solibacillus palustris TaxID=2908203 RepID=A0ABS9U9K0_9BACL|nr:ABC transporter ATP-binding protein [Solibacillus sp. MA9]MCH7320987.1 ABC transporter ATP-binding protein [Solibacillus sp. MA9]
MNVIEVNNVWKRIKKFQLTNISFHVEAGTIAGFIGQNGSGKSTTLKLLLNLLKPDEGELFILGKNVADNEVDIKAQIGVVFDELHIPQHLTAKDINSLYRELYPKWNTDTFYGLLERFDVPKYDAIKKMSKGMKAKLGIIVALSYDPKVLLLDEPTSGLDPIVRDEVLELLQTFMEQEDRAILISSHITSDLEKIADSIVFIHEGKMLFHENKDELQYGYGIWKGTHEEAKVIPKHAIIGKRDYVFGVEYLVQREFVSPVIELTKPTIDELMLFFVRGRK